MTLRNLKGINRCEQLPVGLSCVQKRPCPAIGKTGEIKYCAPDAPDALDEIVTAFASPLLKLAL